MIDIVIEYPYMGFKRKAIGKVPVTWDELTQRQFTAISRVIEGAEPDYHFLSVITGISKDLLKRLSSFELLKISEGIDFVGRAGSFYHDFIIREISSESLIAPKSKLSGLTFGQFIFSDAYFNEWNETKNEASLNKFIAVLYLMPQEKFSQEIIESRIEVVASVDINVRKAIALNYALIVVWLQKAYPLIFAEQETFAVSTDPPKVKTSPWLDIFESLVGDDLINRDHYAELPVHTVFKHLTKKYKENARK